MRAPERSLDISKLRLNQNMMLETTGGDPIDNCNYLLFTIETAKTRDDWFVIPEIKEAHEKMRQAIRQDELKPEKETLPYFRSVCISCPDLLYEHAVKLADDQAKRLNGEISKDRRTAGGHMEPWPLTDLNPFGPGP